jgi:hypothetical protein
MCEDVEFAEMVLEVFAEAGRPPRTPLIARFDRIDAGEPERDSLRWVRLHRGAAT